MSSIEATAMDWTGIDWLGRGWLLILAFTAATLLVAMLRKPCRRLFGAERAFQLWLLPPLAMLAGELPHAAMPVAALPPVVIAITSVVAALPAHAARAGVVDWRAGVALAWLVGSVLSLLLAALAQERYRTRLRGATVMASMTSRWPVLRAVDTDVGPALVGAWRTRIVLPADFEQRYDTGERALILAHETAHARRRDGWWCLLARILAALCWFHPLAWWALAALRHDQELACDAAVLREHGELRRCYAHAMLKTQSAAFALPVGCPWSPRHPITERIAMLKQSQPGRLRRVCGLAFVMIVAIVGAGGVYAATQSTTASSNAAKLTTVRHYRLKLALGIDDQPPRLHANICLSPGRYYDVTERNIGKLLPWHGRFTVAPVEHGQLEVRAELSGGPMSRSGFPRIRMRPGQRGTIQLGEKRAGKDGKVVADHTIKIDLTPSIGC
ncbi:MAG: peptidase M56 [Xanthomonadaceae bacterium]|nr:peptidase M56 [Xanthomonadaceae bacterium]